MVMGFFSTTPLLAARASLCQRWVLLHPELRGGDLDQTLSLGEAPAMSINWGLVDMQSIGCEGLFNVLSIMMYHLFSIFQWISLSVFSIVLRIEMVTSACSSSKVPALG